MQVTPTMSAAASASSEELARLAAIIKQGGGDMKALVAACGSAINVGKSCLETADGALSDLGPAQTNPAFFEASVVCLGGLRTAEEDVRNAIELDRAADIPAANRLLADAANRCDGALETTEIRITLLKSP